MSLQRDVWKPENIWRGMKISMFYWNWNILQIMHIFLHQHALDWGGGVIIPAFFAFMLCSWIDSDTISSVREHRAVNLGALSSVLYKIFIWIPTGTRRDFSRLGLFFSHSAVPCGMIAILKLKRTHQNHHSITHCHLFSPITLDIVCHAWFHLQVQVVYGHRRAERDEGQSINSKWK